MRRVDGEANHAVAAIVEIELQSLHLLGLDRLSRGGLGLVLSLLLVVLLLFLFLLLLFLAGLLPASILLLAHAELVVGVDIEEHDVGVILRSP